MGYFSELDITLQEENYYEFKDLLIDRYEELKNRYFEMLDNDAPCSGENFYSKSEYLYSPIQHFDTIRDIYNAMEIIKEELNSRYDIEIDEKFSEEKNEESDSEQLTMFEIVLLPTWFQTAAA